ncbi:bacillithiol biosynthesis cysteine-adding enzyme BshC [Gracilibacillus sp. S3-1-1]|uniref:Bacillithiol biosynthesis cysteine-adding enzyme BshC n=1 Tax=Gracilibacillus pellucidus TaxID=3095368 RepID=A0ACC6M1U3_9BACI|nr:bacillithiol biosynthesis cysteine-adding enzyme BshC [Gracilibacillus sp. S3-1-1]MDX8044920.1 bacillithiol biosynthesis cysteine-adding enzyme BshC [Gracilibacillus sp. S3-1-1]
MRIESKRLDLHNKFILDYKAEVKSLLDHFDYNPYQENVFEQRMQELKERKYQREELANTLLLLNKRWNGDEATYANIERLKDPNSVVVIGGQQAGILTGPLYTINKIISIIALAKEQEKALGVPVLPVFWIAGEDHDFPEVNHLYLPEDTELKKYRIDDEYGEKTSVSHRELNKEQALKWLQSTFRSLKETAVTKSLFEKLQSMLEQAENYVDFFASFIHDIFRDTGLILVDSGNRAVRQLESPYFAEIIRKQPEISEKVYHSLQSMRTKGYHVSVDASQSDAHLFVEVDGERILLQKDGDNWVGKNEECSFSSDELLNIAEQAPERLSNNVVTRPLMQEKLFPTLAFFAGPSEAAYWSILKGAFQSVSVKMPPVLPRISLTLVEDRVKKLLTKYSIAIDSALHHGVQTEKQNWLSAQMERPIEELANQWKDSIIKGHQPLKLITEDLTTDVTQYADKNLQLILQHVDQLTNRLTKEHANKYQMQLTEFDYIQMHLKPGGGLQERIWNIVYFLNVYGYNWVNYINKYEFDWKEQHYLVYL